jgi:hypothetical protein
MLRLSKEKYKEMFDNLIGYCLSCKLEKDCVEPDVAYCVCSTCGKSKLFGVEELLFEDKLEIIDEPDSINVAS